MTTFAPASPRRLRQVRFNIDVQDPGVGGDLTRNFVSEREGKAWIELLYDGNELVATRDGRTTRIPREVIVQYKLESDG